MLQSCKDNLLRCLLNLASKKDLVEYSIDLQHCISFFHINRRRHCTAAYLIKVKHQIKLTNIAKELVQHFNEEVDSFQIGELIVVLVDTGAEKQARIATIDDLQVVSELYEIRLVLLIARSHQTVDFAFELLLLVVVVWTVPLGETCFASESEISKISDWDSDRLLAYWRF